MKRTLSLLLAAIMLCGVISTLGVTANADPGGWTLANPFTDILPGKWFTEAVLYCYKYGYMAGTADATFAPNMNLTRAMFVQILYTASMADEKYETSTFSDVEAGKWYFNAIEWAAQNGYAGGTGNGYFSPNADITRETLAQFLYTYSKKNNIDVSARADLNVYSDRSRIASWAFDALSWAVAEKLMSGTSATTLSSKMTATRAQTAMILKNYLSKFGIEWDEGTLITERTCTVDGQVVFTALNRENVTKTVTYKAWHRFEVKSQRAATCTEDGYYNAVCLDCSLKKEETTKALGHTTSNGICARCGAEVFPNVMEKLRYYVRNSTSDFGSSTIEFDRDVDGCNYFGYVGFTKDSNTELGLVSYSPYYNTTSGSFAGFFMVRVFIPYVSTSYEYDVYWIDRNDNYEYIAEGYLKPGDISSNPSTLSVKNFGKYYGPSDEKSWFITEFNKNLVNSLKAMTGSIFKTRNVGGITLKDIGFKNFG